MHVRGRRAQSFVEFALVLPLLLIILLGVVEITLFIGSYINVLDLTRSAARFASNRDPFSAEGTHTCAPVSTSKTFDFFYDTSCIFSPLSGTSGCAATFCDGFNSTLQFKAAEDDILIYVFTESKNAVTNQPEIIPNNQCSTPPLRCINNPWNWSNNDADTSHNDNWKKDCKGNLTTPAAAPNFNKDIMQSYLSSDVHTMGKGFVVVEAIFCYHQVLNVPIFSNFLLNLNPMKIDTYSIMPLPYAQPLGN